MDMARIVEEFGEVEGADIVALAGFLQQQQPRPAAPSRRRPLITVTRSEARAATGSTSDCVAARIVREAAEAIAGDSTEAEAVAGAVALLREIGPRDAREAMIARRLVALDALAMETLALARASTGLLRDAYAGQAVALSRAATSLDEALERRRVGKPEQRVGVQYIRGGQVVGMVSKQGGAD
jgi:hypothetical protein